MSYPIVYVITWPETGATWDCFGLPFFYRAEWRLNQAVNGVSFLPQKAFTLSRVDCSQEGLSYCLLQG